MKQVLPRIILSILFFAVCTTITHAQIDPTLLKRIPTDSTNKTMNMDAVYNRPFLSFGKIPVALGGYVEANWQHLATDGISDGHQFQFRRLTLFVSSTVAKRIKFLTEIELEDAKELSIEFAAVDIELHPLLNFRGGIILNPIGAFNQNHDGPKWEFTDRPLSATEMLPATWSTTGFGLYGKRYAKDWMFGYEFYVSGGFDATIIDNGDNRTSLAAAKENDKRFVKTINGQPLYTGKLAIRNRKIGELGFSYMGGIYNKFRDEGLEVDVKRRLDVFALDFNTTLPKIGTYIVGEWAWVKVQVPNTYSQQYGNRQRGGFIDIVQPVLRRRIFNWTKASFNVACRLEYVDWNVGNFKETGGKIGDEVFSVMPGISFRPTPSTVFRFNYRYRWDKDLLGNPPSKTGGFVLGISSYF